MVAFPNRRGVQMAPPEAGYSGFSGFFEECSSFLQPEAPTPQREFPPASLHTDREARGVLECIQALELALD